VYAYDGLARKAVHTLKFRSGRYLVDLMAAQMQTAFAQRPLAADLLIPVPLSTARMRDRGYNQAELLARGIEAAAGAALAPTLLAREERRAQQTLAAADRRQNVRGAFRCVDPTRVRGKRCLVLDDVMTTGATLSACADALVAAGAARVSAVVYARDL
jgi:ComF family protein